MRQRGLKRAKGLRIYCDGVFDLFHYGHARVFKQIKEAFPDSYLIVGVVSDELTLKHKGTLVLSCKERVESVGHCKYVDEIWDDAPWMITEKFLAERKIDYVAHDDIPYACGEMDDIYKPLKDTGRFIATKRTDGISTTGLITRIIKNYDNYLWRQIQRGVSRVELNISRFEERRIRLARRIRSEIQVLKRRMKRLADALSRGGVDDLVGRFMRFVREWRMFEVIDNC